MLVGAGSQSSHDTTPPSRCCFVSIKVSSVCLFVDDCIEAEPAVPDLSRIIAVARADQVLVGVWPDRGHPHGVLVELDGRRWVLYNNPQVQTDWIAALAGPGGEPVAGSELALPCMPGEEDVPFTWWGRFRDASHPLPELSHPCGPQPKLSIRPSCRLPLWRQPSLSDGRQRVYLAVRYLHDPYPRESWPRVAGRRRHD